MVYNKLNDEMAQSFAELRLSGKYDLKKKKLIIFFVRTGNDRLGRSKINGLCGN